MEAEPVDLERNTQRGSGVAGCGITLVRIFN